MKIRYGIIALIILGGLEYIYVNGAINEWNGSVGKILLFLSVMIGLFIIGGVLFIIGYPIMRKHK